MRLSILFATRALIDQLAALCTHKTWAAGRKTSAPQPDFRQPPVTVSWSKRPLTGQAAQFLALRSRSRQGRAEASLPAGFVRHLRAFNPPFKAPPRNGFDRFRTLLRRDPRPLRRSFLTGRSCLSPCAAVSRRHPPFTRPMGAPFHYSPRLPGDHQHGKPRRSSPPASPSRPPPRGLPCPPSP